MTPLEVLNNKKKGTMLYSPCFGHVVLDRIDGYSNYIYVINTRNTFCEAFLPNGRSKGEKDAEIMLFPSINMKEWDKFAFKKGDILQHNGGMECVEFIEYETSEENPANNYTMFKGKYILPEDVKGNVNYFVTLSFSLMKKPVKNKFRPFDKILCVDDSSIYQVDIVKYEDNCWLHTFCEPPIHINSAYPYKEEMAEFVGYKVTEETKKKLEEILKLYDD